VKPLDASWVKLARAREHGIDLKNRIDAYFAEQPYGVSCKHGPEPNEFVVRARVTKQPLLIFGLLTGECAHQLRSALDCAIGDLIQLGTGAPPRADLNFEFPIFGFDSKYAQKKMREKTAGVSPEVFAVIEGFQPYKRQPLDHQTLWLLHQIDIEDKHRSLHVVSGGAALAKIEHVGMTGEAAFSIDTRWIDNPTTFPLEDGTQIFGFFSCENNPRVEIEVNPFIGFENPAVARGRNVRILLSEAFAHVNDILSRLADAAGCAPV
jgi:hypothetical protein